MQQRLTGGLLRAAQLLERSSHPFLLIKLFPNDTIKSQAIITMIAAPHLYLSRFFAPGISFIKDAGAVGVPGSLASATPADEPFAGTGVPFCTEGCAVGALGSSSPVLDGTSGFKTSVAGGCAAAIGSWD